MTMSMYMENEFPAQLAVTKVNVSSPICIDRFGLDDCQKIQGHLHAAIYAISFHPPR